MECLVAGETNTRARFQNTKMCRMANRLSVHSDLHSLQLSWRGQTSILFPIKKREGKEKEGKNSPAVSLNLLHCTGRANRGEKIKKGWMEFCCNVCTWLELARGHCHLRWDRRWLQPDQGSSTSPPSLESSCSVCPLSHASPSPKQLYFKNKAEPLQANYRSGDSTAARSTAAPRPCSHPGTPAALYPYKTHMHHWDPTEQLDSSLVFPPSQCHAFCTKPKSSSQSGGSFQSSLSLPQHHL